MKYGQIRKYDISNGPGIRTSVFVTGCTHKCKGCFNELYMDFDYGSDWTEVQTNLVSKCMQEKEIAGLSLLGGEPFQNTAPLIPIVRKIREELPPDKTIWVYSGYTFEQLMADELKVELLELCDVLVDGKFVLELKNPRLKFRGSANQRILDIRQSLAAKQPVLIPEYNN